MDKNVDVRISNTKEMMYDELGFVLDRFDCALDKLELEMNNKPLTDEERHEKMVIGCVYSNLARLRRILEDY